MPTTKLSTATGKSIATDAAQLSTTTGKSVATNAAQLPTTSKSVATDAAQLSTTGESVAADEAAFKGEPTTKAQATFKSEPATEAEAIDEGKSRARAQANATGASIPAISTISTAVHATMPAISAMPTVREPVDWPVLSKSTTDCESRTNATNQSISNRPTTDQTDAAVSVSMPTTISTHAIKAATSEKACVPGTSGVIIV
ncbi:hypothetical protein [Brevibacillus sp. FIR094]|uniref:hypothetical protein n=1 Tax=Brevibacillus sp. FIR094 TaxID=3134809 RepID=UPI003D1CCD0F